MSARRQARARGQASSSSTIPPLLASRLHPGWDNAETISAQLGHLLRPVDAGRLAMHPRSLYGVLLDRWATENGLSNAGRADWPKLRAAGLIGTSTVTPKKENP